MKKNIYTPLLNGFVYVDFDVDNPACSPRNPFVRIGYVDKLPETVEEHAKFVAEHEIVGKKRDVIGSIPDNEFACAYTITNAWLHHNHNDIIQFAAEKLDNQIALGSLLIQAVSGYHAYRYHPWK